jgi:hypothetical protein
MGGSANDEFKDEGGHVVALRIEERLLLDWSKELFTKSVEVALDYCKNMATASVAAIPLYYGLFAFVVPDDWVAGSFWMKVLICAPAIFFLIASAILSTGALPNDAKIDLNRLTKATTDPSGQPAEAVREDILTDIKTKARIGTSVFAAAIILSAGVVGWVAFDNSRPGKDEPQHAVVVSQSEGVMCGQLLTEEEPGRVVIQPTAASSPISLTDVTELHTVKKCP